MLFLCLLVSVHAWSQERGQKLVERGQYIFSLAGGCACHTAPKGTPNVGARELPIPMAKIYSTNLTSDKETGLGDWSDQELRDAITKGVRPNGERLLPAMPYELLWGERTLRSVANLTRADGEEFLELAPRVPVRTEVTSYPLVAANQALADLRTGRVHGAAVLVP